MTIWKYRLVVEDEQTLEMPIGAIPLCVQIQSAKPYLWALVDDYKKKEPRKFITRGTGHEFNEVGKYIGTYQLQNGMLVFHVFEAA
jgi:hypothetical protein